MLAATGPRFPRALPSLPRSQAQASTLSPAEVCLKDPMSVADSLYNLQLVQDFCASRLPRGCPLSLEDLLYVPPPLQVRPSWGLKG